MSAIQTEPGDRLEPEGESPLDTDVVAGGPPRGPRSRNTTIAAVASIVGGAIAFIWGMDWFLYGLSEEVGTLTVGGLAVMVLGAWSAVGGALLFRRVQWARPAMVATYGVHAVAITVFGLISAAASGADAAPYLISAALLAAAVAMIWLLRTESVEADFPRDRESTAGRTVALWSIVAVWSLPTVGLLLSSFRAERTVKTEGWWTIFTNPQLTIENYTTVLESGGGSAPNMFEAFLNSIAIVLPATVIPISIALFAAYAFAWMDFPGRRWLFVAVVSLMAVPLQMALIPLLQLYTGGAHIGSTTIFPDLDINGKALAVWLTHTGFGLPLAIFLLFNYVSGLPKDIFEAARIDGADHYTIFWRLIVPLSVPALAAFGIFQFLWTWNDYLVALTFLGANADAHPLTMRLANLSGGRGQDWHVLTAAAFVTMAVPLVVFFSLQRYFVRGLLAGSVKG
ncbi:MAG TPA: carbohydrate ABC transporter permease [Acidimicrobiales bacterium]|nr:carbohydrate ABC transporter permease [Acidimicrobiales bacterium]